MTYDLILENDSTNSYKDIVYRVSQLCNYPLTQSEQLTLLAHEKGEVCIMENVDPTLATEYVRLFNECKISLVALPHVNNN